jgi:malic enzyme
MKLAAARAIAELARGDELVPNALDQRVHDAVAAAVAAAASTTGIARPERATELRPDRRTARTWATAPPQSSSG